jgi:hypothetical protein
MIVTAAKKASVERMPTAPTYVIYLWIVRICGYAYDMHIIVCSNVQYLLYAYRV